MVASIVHLDSVQSDTSRCKLCIMKSARATTRIERYGNDPTGMKRQRANRSHDPEVRNC
jgi:hypothetical protein